jgi:hypothetical protein
MYDEYTLLHFTYRIACFGRTSLLADRSYARVLSQSWPPAEREGSVS